MYNTTASSNDTTPSVVFKHTTLFDINYTIAVLYVTMVVTFSAIGTLGNTFLLYVMRKDTKMNLEARMFIANNAIADLCVSVVADPMCIIGAFTGMDLIISNQWLCVTVASMCLTACICAFFCITCLTVNRYMYICHNKLYVRMYNKVTTLLMCFACWIIAFGAEFPNFIGWGGHFFDPKSHQCIWDRTADRSYTLFVALVLIGSPILLMGYCNAAVLARIWHVKKTVLEFSPAEKSSMKQAASSSKILISLFVVFLVCWTPYCLMLILEQGDTFTMATHLFVTLLAHSHSTTAPVIYFIYKRKFCNYIRYLFGCTGAVGPSSTNTSHPSNHYVNSKTAPKPTMFAPKDSATTTNGNCQGK